MTPWLPDGTQVIRAPTPYDLHITPRTRGLSWNPARMIRAIPIRILRQVLLVIVGAEAISCRDITELFSRGQSIGRLLVDVAVDPPVDLITVQFAQCPGFNPPRPFVTGRFRAMKTANISINTYSYKRSADAALQRSNLVLSGRRHRNVPEPFH
jgi:hypothetical protein